MVATSFLTNTHMKNILKGTPKNLIFAAIGGAIIGAVLILVSTQGSLPLSASIYSIGSQSSPGDANERIVHTTDRTITDDHYVETNGYSFRPWNDMLYRSARYPEERATYFFRDVDAGNYSVWVDYGKYTNITYIKTYLALGMPITVNDGSQDQIHHINLKQHWESHWGAPPNVKPFLTTDETQAWKDSWVRVGNGTIAVSQGNTVTVSFSNTGNTGTSHPMLGHVKIVLEEGGGGEGGPCASNADCNFEECCNIDSGQCGTCQEEVDHVLLYLDADGDGTVTGMEAYSRRHELMQNIGGNASVYDLNSDGVISQMDYNLTNTYINDDANLQKEVSILEYLDSNRDVVFDEVEGQARALIAAVSVGAQIPGADFNFDGISDQNDVRLAINYISEVDLLAHDYNHPFKMLDMDESNAVEIYEVIYGITAVHSALQNGGYDSSADYDGNGVNTPLDINRVINYIGRPENAGLKRNMNTFIYLDTDRDMQISTTEIRNGLANIMRALENGSNGPDPTGDGLTTPADVRAIATYLSAVGSNY